MALFQVLPAALNQWAGNQFVPAPVNWAPRPKPLYEAALEQQAPTGQPSPAQQALGIDAGFQGGSPGSDKGKGLNAQSPNLGSFIGSALTTPIGAFTSLGAQAVANALSGSPGRTIESLGFPATVQALGEALGIGGGGYPGDSTLGSIGNPGPGNPSVPGSGEGDNPFESSIPGNSSVPGRGDGENPFSGMYYKGGKVTKLLAPDPSGPDHGYAGLQLGEYVVKKGAAVHYGKGLMDAINDKKIDKVKLKGLLERP